MVVRRKPRTTKDCMKLLAPTSRFAPISLVAPISLLAASCWLNVANAAVGNDPLASLRFSDGKSRTLDDFQKQSVLVMYFCGHCPNAAAYLGKQTKELYDFIESHKVPVTLVLATPDIPPPGVIALNKDRGYHMDNALWASDPLNHENISLNNVYQQYFYAGDHRIEQSISWQTPDQIIESAFSSSKAGEFRYTVDGLSDATAKDVWWQVERQRPGAVRTLVASAKGKSPAQLELQKVLGVVKASFNQRETDLVAAPITMATYESLEALLAEAQGLELKDASGRYKELGKAKELKGEFDARNAFQQCQAMAASPKPDNQAAAKAGFAQIAKKYPDTLYGQRAANLQ
jgi:hypothetical protein